MPNGLPPCPGGNFYTIRAGDTLFSIARRFGISVDDLREANPGIDPNNLQIGQVICIPLAVPPVVCPPGSTIYTIRSGDTFFTIARRFNISLDALIAANPGVNPEALLIGQQICVPGAPGPGVCPPGTIPYTIRAGDTFFTLARTFNTTVNAIIRANPNVDPNSLRIGQLICIPSAAPPAECPPGARPYRIQAGDTFFNLAQRFGTTVEDIQRLNPRVNPQNLQIGQVICIP